MQHDHRHWPTQLPFDNGPIRALSVYCCDGRFGAHHEAYTNRLGFSHHDRLVVPGGSACLVRHHPSTEALREEVTLHLEFLLTTHAIEQVVMLAHDDCMFYQQTLGVPKETLRETQASDLAKAVQLVRRMKPSVSITAAIAAIEDDSVCFHEIPGIAGQRSTSPAAR